MDDSYDKVFICRCEEVTEEEVDEAIAEGARSLKGVKKRTYAGMGLCQGRTCSKLIMQKLARFVDKENVIPDTQRPPVRAIKIEDLISTEEDDEHHD